MKAIAKFCTLFWILYFPLCIAFYDYVNDYIDEVMTLVLVLYTIIKIPRVKLYKQYKNEITFAICFFVFYLIYSLIKQVNVVPAIFIDFQQQVRPYVVFYCTLLLAPKFNNLQKKGILISLIFSLVIYYYLTRSSLEENLVLGSLSMSSGLLYYLFTKNTKKNTLISILIVLFGLLSGKFKYIGECVVFISVILVMRKKINIGSLKSVILGFGIIASTIYFTWERFDAYYVSGMSNENLARPMMYKTMPKVIADYFPFGPGLGTFGTSASAKTYYSPLYYEYKLDQIWGMSENDRGAFNADSFYPSLAQYGIVGILVFCMFWKRRLKEMNKIIDIKHFKIALLAFACLAIESAADTSYLSGRGMVYFMLLGLCLSSTLKKGYYENRSAF